MSKNEIVIRQRFALPVGHHFLLFLLFLGLKLAGAIEWNWVWVFLPLIAKVALLGASFITRLFDFAEEDDDDGMDI